VAVFDISNRDSFERMGKWIGEGRKYVGGVPLIIVANKNDLESERKVKKEEIKEFVDIFDAIQFECSAKTGENINCFHQALLEAQRLTY